MIAKLRYWFWRYVRRYRYEICQRCGRPVELVWRARDDIWERIVGGPGGILCISCFDKLVREVDGGFLYWSASFDPEPFFTVGQLMTMEAVARRSANGGVYVYFTGEERSQVRLATVEVGPVPKNRHTVYRLVQRHGKVIREWGRDESRRDPGQRGCA